MATTDLLTLAEARSALRIPASDTSHDADLTNLYIPALTKPVEDVVGPVVSQTYTANFDGGSGSITLPHVRVTVTGVVENGITLTADTDYVVDSLAGLVFRGTQIGPRPFFFGRQNVQITWTAGAAASTTAVAPNIKLAARIILAQAWQSDQQGYRASVGGPDMTSTPSGFLIPRRAMELLSGDDRIPGFA